MWTVFMHAFFALCGACLMAVAVRHLLSPPERGRPDSLGRFVEHYFFGAVMVLVATGFLAFGVAALFFGADVGVSTAPEFVLWIVVGLVLNAIGFAWRRLRRRASRGTRPAPDGRNSGGDVENSGAASSPG